MTPLAQKRTESLLLERARELQAMERALDRLQEGVGSIVLVEGPAGIGKTRLLAEGIELARPRELLVRSARGGQLEREMPFGIARQLFEPVIERASTDERTRLLGGSAALALIALGHGEPGRERGQSDPFAPIHGLYWLVANLADSRPLVLVIDDAHWADAQTLRWLDYLGRRLAELPVLVVAGARTGEPDEPEELDPLRLAAELVRPGPLTPRAVSELVTAALGRDPTPEFTDACTGATAGNPFLLAEVLRTMRADSIEPGADAAASLAQLGSESIARYVLLRLGRFGVEAVGLAQAIAVLGGSPQLRHAAKLAGMGQERAAELCDRLREAEILAPGLPIEFVHPLVREAIYLEWSEEDRSAAHRRAGQLLSSTGASARDVALHLLVCPPNGDEWVVSQLRHAAQEAMRAGAPDAARTYLERALAEPPEHEAQARYELGRALWGADPMAAPEILRQVAEEIGEPALRRQALADTAWTYFDVGNLDQAIHWLTVLLDESTGDEALSVEAALFCLRCINGGRRPADSKRIRARGADVGTRTPGELLIRLALSFERFMACDPVGEVVELAGTFPPPWTGEGAVPGFASKVLAWSGRFAEAREAIARGMESARSTGLLHVESYRESFLAEIDRLAGRLTDSEAQARTAWDIVRDLPMSLAAWSSISNLLATLIARGELDEASELASGFDLSAPLSELPMSPVPLEIRGTLRLAQGSVKEGVEDLLVLGEDLEGFGLLNPASSPWRQEAAPGLAALGRTAEGEKVIAVGEERARSFGAPHVIGAVLRSRALLEPRRRQIGTLRESVAALEEYGPPHELARSLVELGAALRRDGQRADSREPLRRALELAVRSGAGGIETRAREELAAAGSRPRSAFRTGVASLTASELRTAKLAAEGLSNVEIAQRLFVTRKTVEKHLGNAYTKLEIGSREELPAALADDVPTSA